MSEINLTFYHHLVIMSFLYRLNSAKVLADYIADSKCPNSYYQEAFQGNSTCNTDKPAGKISTDNPNQVSFIYENPRFINEPVCFTNTRKTSKEQHNWWHDSVSVEKKHVPAFNTSTINRSDFKFIEEANRPKGLSRYGCNRDKNIAAKGMVPGHCEESLIAKERISYGHQFDCRKGRKERGRLHGSFVWEPVNNAQLCEKIKERLINNKTSIY